ncbi:unnamed protein product [Caenorhabditis brenneri]
MTPVTPPTLLNIPDVPMRIVLGELDYLSILCFRKTCYRFLDFVDLTIPPKNLKSVIVSSESSDIYSMQLCFNDNTPYLYPNGSTICLKFKKTGENSCELNWYRSDGARKFTLQNMDFSDVFINHLDFFMKFHKGMLPLFEFKDLIITSKNQAIKPKNPIQASRINMEYMDFDQDQISNFLSWFCPESLYWLDISCPEDTPEILIDIKKLIVMKQWKQADNVQIKGFLVKVPVRNFDSFRRAFMKVEEVTAEDIRELKEIFTTTFSYPSTLHLTYNSCLELDYILNYLGPPSLLGPLCRKPFKTWNFDNAANSEFVLELRWEIGKRFEFKHIKRSAIRKDVGFIVEAPQPNDVSCFATFLNIVSKLFW